ncbi:hypothetical protein POM88_004420 [Heracleum sosnowskyi]|uniref:Uncharacterized protein n=1 Tax=Heracleum sosnowskyi TaxID=360622 RepID=A0AAD8JMV8_9APIA|nr:hypothetical protein POM88_004420 [Heracleum sosnowskyi]
MYVDGAVNNNGAGAGIVLTSPEGHLLMSVIHFKFVVTNNEAEYEALINGLKLALEMNVKNLVVFSDSKLVIQQLDLRGVPREDNSKADALAKLERDAVLLGAIPLEIQEIPSIHEMELMVVDQAPMITWMTPIQEYIQKGILPEDKGAARRLKYQDASSLAMKVLQQGYYWPTLKSDAMKFTRACDQCQCFENYSSIPATLLTSMMSPWPFSIWGINLIGELPTAKGVLSMLWFGIPYKLVSDNGKQFDGKEVRKLCDDLKIKKDFATVYNPQSNGKTEDVNKIIKHTLKTKLEENKGNWPEELQMVLWSYNTTPRSTTGESPFMLSYGFEAMVPVEVGSRSFRRDHYDKESNEVNQWLHLDFLEETRAISSLRLAAYQKRVSRLYDRRVRVRRLRVGDLVLRRVMPHTRISSHGVFGANWEGPYKIKSVLWEGTFHLEDLGGNHIPRAWNVDHLKKY